MKDVAEKAIEFTMQEAQPNSPYAKAAGLVRSSLEGRGTWTLTEALTILADTLEYDLRPEWPNDPEGEQRAMVDEIRAAIARSEG